jgi:hypothetical protein
MSARWVWLLVAVISLIGAGALVAFALAWEPELFRLAFLLLWGAVFAVVGRVMAFARDDDRLPPLGHRRPPRGR